MKKCTLSIFSLLLVYLNSIAQVNNYKSSVKSKTVIDSSVYERWSTVREGVMSGDGQYFFYIITNLPVGSNTGVIKELNKNWEMRIPGVVYASFSYDGHTIAVQKSNDSLLIVGLNKSVITGYSNVITYQFLKTRKREYLMLYRKNGRGNELFLYDCRSGNGTSFSSVNSFRLSDNKEALIILEDSVINDQSLQLLNWYKINDQTITNIWKGNGFAGSLVVDDLGSQVAFLVADTVKGNINLSCLYNKLGSRSCKSLFNNQSVGLKGETKIADLFRFSSDGSKLFFHVDEPKVIFSAKASNDVNVNIWSYQDKKLQSLRQKDNLPRHPLLAVCSIHDRSIIPLEQDGELVLSAIKKDKMIVLHSDPDADYNESGWNKAGRGTIYLVSVSSGKRIKLDKIEPTTIGYLSPEEKYVIYSDNRNFYSYDIASGEYRNITEGINTSWTRITSRTKTGTIRGIAGWIENDDAVLIYDRYDIWLLDPKGKRPPTNITNGYGTEHNMIFTLGLKGYANGPISLNNQLILNATDLTTKRNGFFGKNLKVGGDPELLTLGPYVYSMVGDHYPKRLTMNKKHREKYIVSRMSATESPNYFSTTDFKVFSAISQVSPESNYNWYSTELHTWKSLDSTLLQGILYKPENFDSTQKYPLIFVYYERRSDNLNVYLTPDYSSAEIDIPTYVSNGYLVFTPDIDYPFGDPMQGTYNSVISAVKYLSRFSFVDSSRLGIQGFSYGGIQTNYLVANSNLFAAACAGSGLTDMVSAYGTVSLSGASLQGSFQNGGQYRMGVAPWDSPDMYVKNSPIFRANRITTPLLMMHTTNDEACPFPQALELFTALRRLGKKVWLLEYTDGKHSIQGSSAKDFDVRMRQFFDHYLKRKSAPNWMTHGFSTEMKDLKYGLELDSKIGTTDSGYLMIRNIK